MNTDASLLALTVAVLEKRLEDLEKEKTRIEVEIAHVRELKLRWGAALLVAEGKGRIYARRGKNSNTVRNYFLDQKKQGNIWLSIPRIQQGTGLRHSSIYNIVTKRKDYTKGTVGSGGAYVFSLRDTEGHAK